MNGTKIRPFEMFFCPAGAVGFSPGFQPWETSKKAVRPERARDHVGQMRSEWSVASGAKRRSDSGPLFDAGASRNFENAVLDDVQH